MSLPNSQRNAIFRGGLEDIDALRRVPFFSRLYQSLLAPDVLTMVQYYLDDPRVHALLKQLDHDNDPSLVRNVIICGYVDHGRRTLFDELEARNAIARQMATDHPLPSFSSLIPFVTLSYLPPYPEPAPARMPFIINMAVDSITDAPLMSLPNVCAYDGAVLVLDSVEGFPHCKLGMLESASKLGLAPILMVNKLDRLMLELQLDSEEMYQSIIRCVESAKVDIATDVLDPTTSMPPIDPTANVCFGSAKYGWAFSIATFARLYATKFGVNVDVLQTRLWGSNYFDPETKRWVVVPRSASGKMLKRSFCMFILDPICKVHQTIMAKDLPTLKKLTTAVGVSLTLEAEKLSPMEQLAYVMRRWLPLSNVLTDMIVTRIPSPLASQRSRLAAIYPTPPAGDHFACSMFKCNPAGPLMAYVSQVFATKHANTNSNSHYALARVFSGTLRTGASICVLRSSSALSTLPLVRIAVHLGADVTRRLSACSSGSLVLLSEVNPSLEGCTLTSSENAQPICVNVPS